MSAAADSLRDQGLTVELVDGRLVISIGVDALMAAVRGSRPWEEQEEDGRGYAISDVDGFADDILRELEHEEEDGTTLVHIAIDAAIARALDQGSLNIDYGDDG